mmetsp:Transcript_35153/g.104939  ORF Transcript_35153/g.104939 Transcript_35153/m.104939 type:complete len:207 (-) Transcript_35153:934-1554(-)
MPPWLTWEWCHIVIRSRQKGAERPLAPHRCSRMVINSHQHETEDIANCLYIYIPNNQSRTFISINVGVMVTSMNIKGYVNHRYCKVFPKGRVLILIAGRKTVLRGSSVVYPTSQTFSAHSPSNPDAGPPRILSYPAQISTPRARSSAKSISDRLAHSCPLHATLTPSSFLSPPAGEERATCDHSTFQNTRPSAESRYVTKSARYSE